MKHVYFIRHGETVANRKSVHQGPNEILSEKGEAQARHVARFLTKMNIDALLCSPFVRARQTAEYISAELDLPYTQHESVREFGRPAYVYGKSHYSFGSFVYLWRLFKHQEDARWDDHGAENMVMVRNRVLDAKNMISSMEGEHIAVVSHAIFMDMFLKLACLEKKLTPGEFIGALMNVKKTPNTGIMHTVYDENAPAGICKWQLVEFIDPRQAV